MNWKNLNAQHKKTPHDSQRRVTRIREVMPKIQAPNPMQTQGRAIFHRLLSDCSRQNVSIFILQSRIIDKTRKKWLKLKLCLLHHPKERDSVQWNEGYHINRQNPWRPLIWSHGVVGYVVKEEAPYCKRYWRWKEANSRKSFRVKWVRGCIATHQSVWLSQNAQKECSASYFSMARSQYEGLSKELAAMIKQRGEAELHNTFWLVSWDQR